MSVSNYKRTLLQNSHNQNNKENNYTSSVAVHSAFSVSSSAERNNHKGNALSASKTTTFIHKDNVGTISDSRIKTALDSRDEFQKMYEQEKQRRKDETSELRSQVYKLERENDGLEQKKIEFEEEIELLKKKNKVEVDKNDVLEKNLQRLEKQRVLNSSRLSQMAETPRNNDKKIQKLQQQKEKVEELYRSLKESYLQMEKQYQQLKYCQINVLHQENTSSLEESQVQQIQRQWEKDIKYYQNQSRKFIETESRLTEMLAKYEMKVKIQNDDLEFKNQKINKLEQNLQQMRIKLSESSKYSEALQLNLKQQVSEHQKIIYQMQAMFKEEVQAILTKQQDEKQKNKETVEKEYSVKVQKELEQKQHFIEQNLEMIKEMQEKNEKWQTQYKKMVESRDKLEEQVSLMKIAQQKQRAQLQGSHQQALKEYEEQIRKQKSQLSDLIKAKQELSKSYEKELLKNKQSIMDLEKVYEIQVQKNSKLEQLIACYHKKIQETEQTCRRDANLLNSLEEAYTEKEKEFEAEVRELQNQIADINRDYQKSKQANKAEIDCLEMERNQWKSYTNQKNQQLEVIRRQNKKLKKEISEWKEGNLETAKASKRKIQELEANLRQVQNEKKKIIQLHSQELQEMKKKLNKEQQEQYEKLERQISDRVRRQVQKQMKEAHQNELNKLKKKNEEETSEIVHKYQDKNFDLEKQFQSAKKQSYQTHEQIEMKNREIRTLLQGAKELERMVGREGKNNEQLRRQLNGTVQKVEEYRKKLESMKREEEDKWKKSKEQQEGMRRKLQQLKTENESMSENMGEMDNKIKKYEDKIRKLETELVRAREEASEVEKAKWQLEDKILMLERNNARLQAVKSQLQQQLLTVNSSPPTPKIEITQRNSEIDRLTHTIQTKNEQIQTIIVAKKMVESEKINLQQQVVDSKSIFQSQMKSLRVQNSSLQIELSAKSESLLCLQQENQKIRTKIKIMEREEKERQSKLAQLQKKQRMEVYGKLCGISNEFFEIEVKDSQIEFLTILYHKLRIWVDYTSKLKQQMQKYKSLDHMKEEQFNKTRGRHLEENLSLKEQYDIIYRKYLKYKQAYICCRGKIEKQRHDIVQDQRFTEEIITHCQTLMQDNNGRHHQCQHHHFSKSGKKGRNQLHPHF